MSGRAVTVAVLPHFDIFIQEHKSGSANDDMTFIKQCFSYCKTFKSADSNSVAYLFMLSKISYLFLDSYGCILQIKLFY